MAKLKLYNTLTSLEKERKEVYKKLKITIISILIATIVAMYFFLKIFGLQVFFMLIIFASSWAIKYIYTKLTQDFIDDYKAKVIKPLVKSVDKNFKYYPNHHINFDYFNDSNLFPQSPDLYYGDDYIGGVIDGVEIEFCDLDIRTKSKNSTHTIFQGLFLVADFNKHFKYNTIVIPDTAQKLFGDMVGNTLQKNNPNRKKLIKMDDIEFERRFVVYGDDEIETKYILSNSMMQRIVKLQKKSGKNILISFRDTKIFVAIEYNRELFEPSIKRSLLKDRSIIRYAQILETMKDIVLDLKLNEKLWSKE